MKELTDPWAELDAAIDAFIANNQKSKSTLEGYAKHWRVWERFCDHRGFQPLGAPFEAYRALWSAAKDGVVDPAPTRLPLHPGQPWSQSGIDKMFAAIAFYHSEAGLVAAYQQPHHQAAHTQHREGYKRYVARYGKPVESAKPLRPVDIQALQGVQAQQTIQSLTRQALVFLSLDLGLGWEQLRELRPSDFMFVDDETGVYLELDGYEGTRLECLRSERAADPGSGVGISVGVGESESEAVPNIGHVRLQPSQPVSFRTLPVVCTHCIVADACADIDPDVSFAQKTTQDPQPIYAWRNLVALLGDSWAALTATAGLGLSSTHDHDDAWLIAGTRLGLYEALTPNGFIRASAQARALLSWPLGLRSLSDARQLDRRHVKVLEDGRIHVTIPRSKGDQTGKGEVRGLTAPASSADATAFVIRWAAIRDAFNGASPETPFFSTWNRYSRPNALERRSEPAAGEDFEWLQKQAGLSGFTMHSTRTGFAVSAVEAGHSEIDIQDAMRLRYPKTALNYMKQARRPGGSPVEALIAKIAESSDPKGDAA